MIKVRLPGGEVVTIDTQDPEVAKEVARKLAAQQAKTNPVVADEMMFDEETGIRAPKLRAKLGLADTPEEQDNVMRAFVGSDGFVRDSRQRVAVTPRGQDILISRGLLDKENKSDKNIIVDERSFSGVADLLDLSGIFGPVAASIAALAPQGKVLRLLKNNLALGGPRFQRVLASILGGAAGEAAEEILETSVGQQEESLAGQALNVLGEGALSAVGQGVGEAAGFAYRKTLGINAPAETVKSLRELYEGVPDPKLLRQAAAKKFNKKPSEVTQQELEKTQDGLTGSERKRIVKTAQVQTSAFESNIRGRLQALEEAILTPTARQRNLRETLSFKNQTFLDKLGARSLDLDDVSNKIKSGEFTKKALTDKLDNLEKTSKETTKSLDEFIKSSIESINEGALLNKPGTSELGRIIKESLGDSYEEFLHKSIDEYYKVSEAIFGSKKIKRGLSGKRIGQLAYENLTDIRLLIDKNPHLLKALKDFYDQDLKRLGLSAEEIVSIKNYKEFPDAIKILIDEQPINTFLKGQDLFLNVLARQNQIIDFSLPKKRLEKFLADNSAIRNSLERKNVNDVQKLLGFEDAISFNQLQDMQITTKALIRDMGDGLDPKFKDELINLNKYARSVLDDLSQEGRIASQLIRQGRNISPVEIAKIRSAAELLKKANAFHKTGMDYFDAPIVAKLTKEIKTTGAVDIDQAYQALVAKNRPKKIEKFFQGLRKPEKGEMVIDQAKVDQVRKELGAKLLRDEIRNSTDEATNLILPHKLAQRLDDYGETLDVLFENSADLKKFIADLRKINFKPSTAAFDELAKNPSTLTKLYKKVLDDQQALKDFKDSKILRDITKAENSEIVEVLLKPNNKKQIDEVFELLSPAQRQEVRQESMRFLMTKLDDVSDVRGLASVMNAKNFTNTLDSVGDETLDAIFGKTLRKELRRHQRLIQTIADSEQQGGRGALVAATIAVGLATLNPNVAPQIFSIFLTSRIMTNPAVIRFLTSQRSADVQNLVKYINNTLTQLPLRAAASGVSEVGSQSVGALENILQDSSMNQDLNNSLQRKPNIQLPEIQPVTLQQDGLAQDPAIRAAILSG